MQQIDIAALALANNPSPALNGTPGEKTEFPTERSATIFSSIAFPGEVSALATVVFGSLLRTARFVAAPKLIVDEINAQSSSIVS
jgi:hypothetical protein